ncbi:MAG: UMP kinase [Bacteroidales bacterium]|jgi:uridylate kinase|nr:UMP kinase [Bacteroidales bacterium]MDD4213764.1 UMP kinase [Bacteroidales bacterium]
MKYKRILLKLSGEALTGEKSYGLSASSIVFFMEEIRKALEKQVQIAVVIGGGNIFRGLKGNNMNISRVHGDYMGMLATVINGLALQSAFENAGIKCKLLSGLQINPVCELTSSSRICKHLEKGEVVIIAGGTGNPFFTTDTAAVLRALEINADVILKGTRVNGIYDSDPEKNPLAKQYKQLSFDEALEKNLEVMDMTAFALCRDNNMPLVVFNMNVKDNLLKIIQGKTVGTYVTKK